jgi:hypothetical protein
MSAETLPNSGPGTGAWRVAINAWRTLAERIGAAMMISALPALLMLAGHSAISSTLLGTAFAGPDDYPESPGLLLLVVIPELIVYAAGTLIIFVSWIRLLLALQPPAAWPVVAGSWPRVGAAFALANAPVRVLICRIRIFTRQIGFLRHLAWSSKHDDPAGCCRLRAHHSGRDPRLLCVTACS